MPSPFPGMDPYLEGHLWTTLHAALPIEIIRQLSPYLHPRYLALPTERHVVEAIDDITTSVELSHGIMGSAVIVTESTPLRLQTAVPVAVPHVSIEIRDRAERRLVTAIEILSPTNKRGEGREEYLTRRRHFLLSRAHLLEIDLLRNGHRVPLLGDLPVAPYFVFLGRFESRPWTDIWPIPLDEPLPPVLVPLLPGDDDVPLDLQAALTAVYDLLHYELAVDYAHPPDIPLEGEAEAYADRRLREGGLRS